MRARADILVMGILACIVGCAHPGGRTRRISGPGHRPAAPVETPEADLDPLVRRLRAKATRLKAFHELAKRDEPDKTPAFEEFCNDHGSPELVVCPQPAGGETIYVLLYDYLADHSDGLGEFGEPESITFPDTPHAGRGQTERKRDLAIDAFTASGRRVTPFGGNNVVSDGLMCDINGDGFIERADHTPYSLRHKGHMTVLEIERVAEKAELLFAVIYNGKTDDWHYDFTDEDADGVVEIVLGPRRGETVEAKVKYVWDPAARTYVGPEGAPGDHYRVIDHARNVFREVRRVAKDGGIPSEEAGTRASQGEEDDEDDGSSFSLTTRYGFPGEGRAKAAKATPYSYSSLAGLSNEEITRWMGRGRGPAPPVEGVMLYDRLPPGFWSLAPREAALATVELNRSDKHKAAYSLGFVDGEAPETGSVFYYYDSDDSYTARDAHYCIYVGTDESYLAYASTASHGIVGHDYAMDVEQVNLCRLELDPRDAHIGRRNVVLGRRRRLLRAPPRRYAEHHAQRELVVRASRQALRRPLRRGSLHQLRRLPHSPSPAPPPGGCLAGAGGIPLLLGTREGEGPPARRGR
ncbi:MAG: hypothetical protein ACYSU0_21595, partial [Planctomycetota bacterium]